MSGELFMVAFARAGKVLFACTLPARNRLFHGERSNQAHDVRCFVWQRAESYPENCTLCRQCAGKGASSCTPVLIGKTTQNVQVCRFAGIPHPFFLEKRKREERVKRHKYKEGATSCLQSCTSCTPCM